MSIPCLNVDTVMLKSKRWVLSRGTTSHDFLPFALKSLVNVIEDWTTSHSATELRTQEEATGHLAMKAVGLLRRRTKAMLQHDGDELQRKRKFCNSHDQNHQTLINISVALHSYYFHARIATSR